MANKVSTRLVEIPDFINFLLKKKVIFDLDLNSVPSAELKDLRYRRFGVVWGHSGEYESVELTINEPIKRFRGEPYPKLYEIRDSVVNPTEGGESDDLDEALINLFDRIGRGYKNKDEWANPQELLYQLLGEFYDQW